MKLNVISILKNNPSFTRFVIVGFINTFNYYLLYIILMSLNVPYILSHSSAFVISMIGSFYLNCYFTYKTKPTFKKFFQFPMTYVVNYSVTTISLFLFVDILNMNEFVAPLLASIIPIPFTYMVSKWILQGKQGVEIGRDK
ncbi:GtrA family protein [Siminovitchia fortis]|uniref:GtrA family protein n=1 Tax=Siminovitchia fortis TaxID=254758 RepID=A0A443IPZ6_9BACI|nr:GtrA family protein [Siminovitchia fortis]RWR08077.1 GtrA family protein [Siminovitchia fortis]WHY81034.1 GtrA family protein [Siminovitchia fortis]